MHGDLRHKRNLRERYSMAVLKRYNFEFSYFIVILSFFSDILLHAIELVFPRILQYK